VTSPGTQPEPQTEWVPADDRVIGRAFRWSLVAIALIAGAVALAVWWQRRAPEPEVVTDAPIVAPRMQARTAQAPDLRFTDITELAGMRFVHDNGARGDKLLPETMGPGCAFLDHDGDGDADVLLVNGRPWPDDAARAGERPTPALYRNDGGGRFTEVTREAGLDVSLYGMGIAAGDYDNDGRVDVFLSGVGRSVLLRNVGGRFVDVTAQAGVGGADDAWSTSCGFADFDNDGDLDLFVCNYVRWSRAIDLEIDYRLTGIGRAYGPPTNFAGAQPCYYRNDGDGTFTECAERIGLHVHNAATGAAVAKALALLPLDYDGDGALDLFLANDTTRNFLYRNKGDGTFTEVGVEAGVAFDPNGMATGAMGIDGACYRNDRTLGIAIGNFATEMTSFFVAQPGARVFSDEAITEGIGPASRAMLTFGLFFFDADLDGRVDLLQANGHLEEEINTVQPSQHYAQPAQLFWNCGPRSSSCFAPVDAARTGDLGKPIVGRGAAYADIDGDGDLDVLLTQVGRRAVLLRNDQQLGNRWLRLKLVGRRCNRDAIAAVVEIDAGGATQRAQVMPTRSYLSQVELVLTFGLGAAARADAVRVRWPGEGEVQELGALDAGAHVIEQR
jgi:hypothetical protein